MRSLVRASASRRDWLQRNWDGWCSVSLCAGNTSIIKDAFTTPVPDLELSSVQSNGCQQTFIVVKASDSALLTIVRVYKLYLLTYLNQRNSVHFCVYNVHILQPEAV